MGWHNILETFTGMLHPWGKNHLIVSISMLLIFVSLNGAALHNCKSPPQYYENF